MAAVVHVSSVVKRATCREIAQTRAQAAVAAATERASNVVKRATCRVTARKAAAAVAVPVSSAAKTATFLATVPIQGPAIEVAEEVTTSKFLSSS